MVILKFFDIIYLFKPFFSEDILLGDFSRRFLSLFVFKNNLQDLFNLLFNQILKSNCCFTLEFSCENSNHINDQFFSSLSSLIDSKVINQMPLVLLDYSKLNKFDFDFLCQQLVPKLKKFLI